MTQTQLKPEQLARKFIDEHLQNTWWKPHRPDFNVETANKLLKSCNVHTILRLPLGTFTYIPGVKANVIFFDKGVKTKNVWVYGLRTNMDNINKGNSLKDEHFKEFISLCEKQKETDRFKKYSYETIEKDRDYNLDVKWIKDDLLHTEYEDPDVILENIKESEEKILEQIDKITSVL